MSDPDLRDPRLDEAYRRMPGEEPPRELDDRIRAAARRAVGARPRSTAQSWISPWRVPLALAATIVLTVTLTLMVYESEEAPPPLRAPAPAATGVPAPAGEAAKPEAKRPAEPPAPQAPGTAAPPRSFASEAARQAAPPSATELREERAAEPLAKRRDEASKPAVAPAPAPSVAAPSPAAPAAPAPAADAAAPAPAAPPAPHRQRLQSAPEGEVRPGPARERGIADRPAGRASRESAVEAARVVDRSALRTPEDWIAEMRRLKREGRTDEAAKLLEEFRTRFPGHAVPEDLR
jgi:hypothetical protein